MKTIRHTTTLFYYDGPQVFEAQDTIGGNYIAVMLEPNEKHTRYVVTGVAPERLRNFRSGILDLRSLMADSDEDEWYLAETTNGLDQPLKLMYQSTSLEESGFLPDSDFVLHESPPNEFVLKEARERNNLIFEFTAAPPETTMEHRIRMNTLAGLLLHIQTMVKHAFKKAMSGHTPDYWQSDDHLMDVIVPAAPGSFRVVLEAATKPDLFSNSSLAFALQHIDEIFEHTANPEYALAVLKNQRGHLAGSFLKLVNFLLEHHTGLRYSWAEPNSDQPNSHFVTETEIGPLVEVLSSVTDLGIEQVTLEGEFESFNRGSSSWGLLTEEGKISGKIREGGPNLDGLEVGGHYKFHCNEEIEEIGITGRESHKLYLNRHEPV